MDRELYYEYYQENLELLNHEINMVKKSAQAALGKKAWLERNSPTSPQLPSTEVEIKAGTRLYTFLICSWLEARLMKMLYENSAAAFSDLQITQIRQNGTMAKKWEMSFTLAICNSYNFNYAPNLDYSLRFSANSLQQRNYQDVKNFLQDISDAITIRNRLAHGQWAVQFNSANTELEAFSFFQKYDNIQKLGILQQCFNHIANIISAYATYKDKQNAAFDLAIRKEVDEIENKKRRIASCDFSKYMNALSNNYENKLKLLRGKD